MLSRGYESKPFATWFRCRKTGEVVRRVVQHRSDMDMYTDHVTGMRYRSAELHDREKDVPVPAV